MPPIANNQSTDHLVDAFVDLELALNTWALVELSPFF
jgi:hypothetical protein